MIMHKQTKVTGQDKQKTVIKKEAAALDRSGFTAERFIKKLKTYQSDEELKKFQRFFKFVVGQQNEDDKFIGVRMGQIFALAKEFIEMPTDEIEKLLESPIHEVRVGGCSIMDKQGRSKKTPDSHRKELFDL